MRASITTWSIAFLAVLAAATTLPGCNDAKQHDAVDQVQMAQVPMVELIERQSVARKRLAGYTVQFQKESFAEFRKNIPVQDVSTYATANVKLAGTTLMDLQTKLAAFYTTLPVSATVQVPIPQSTSVVSFDCVPSARQPALRAVAGQALALEAPPVDPDDHGHTVAPRAAPDIPSGASSTPSADPKIYLLDSTQAACPAGTVAIRRNTLPEAATRAAIKQWSLWDERAAVPGPHSPTVDRNAMRSALNVGGISAAQTSLSQHRYAHAAQAIANYGVAARLSVWSPRVLEGDMSLSQVWVIGGNPNDSSLQTAEAGWQVYTYLWDPKYSAFFVYQTSDNYGSSGCYVTLCSGSTPSRPETFRITTNKIVIGKPIQPQSTVGGNAAVIEVKWVRHATTGSWWLKVDNEWIGYYPATVYAGGALTVRSNYIDFGGEATGVTPTSEMGSGHYAQEGNGYASFQSRLRYVDASGKYLDATVQPYQTDNPCYTLSLNAPDAPETNPGAYFYFGGPGVHHFHPSPDSANKEACTPPTGIH